MIVYLAGITTPATAKREFKKLLDENNYNLLPIKIINNLESYYYLRKAKWSFPLFKRFGNFILDSGAFTYMSGNGENVNWDSYIEEYAAFINKYEIELFFELDIDSIVGLKEVERLRDKLEKLTRKQCIPVWHKSRGLDYFKKMISNYKFVAIGGIVTKEIKGNEHPIFTNLINLAHSKGCKIHGLGYTNLKGLIKYKFDSVDSTAWLSGNKFGAVYYFNGVTMGKVKKQIGQRVRTDMTYINNINQWIKFSQYAEHNL